MPSARQLNHQRNTLEIQYSEKCELLEELAQNWAIENDPTTRFKLRRQIEKAEAELAKLDRDLTRIEVELGRMPENQAAEATISLGPELTTRELLYKNHRILGRFFTAQPFILGAALSLISIIFLVLPAYFLGIGFIRCTNGNHGFLHPSNWNWGIMYTVILPVLFALAAWVSSLMREGVSRLHRKVGIIKVRLGCTAVDYLQAMSDRLDESAKRLVIIAAGVTFAAMAWDTWDLWWGYLPGHKFPTSVKPDWDTAFTGFVSSAYADKQIGTITCDGFSPPGYAANLVFDLVAYSFQAASIFLGLFWISKFWLFLKAFSDLLGKEKSTYCLELLEHDPRLGLQPLGRMFNWFLIITVLLQLYVFVHRIQVIGQWRSTETAYDYVADVWRGFNRISSWGSGKFYGFDGLGDPGVWITLLLITFPIIAVCYFPLYKLYSHVNACKDRLKDENAVKRNAAKAAGDEEEAQKYERIMTRLDGANVWPNGDSTALRFLTTMGILAVSSWLPPLFPLLVFGWLLAEIFLGFKRRLPTPRHR